MPEKGLIYMESPSDTQAVKSVQPPEKLVLRSESNAGCGEKSFLPQPALFSPVFVCAWGFRR